MIDEQLSMHCFDSRGVHRIFTVTLSEGTLHYVRTAPGFSQGFTLTMSGERDTMAGRAELSRDGTSWEDDLAVTYRRVG